MSVKEIAAAKADPARDNTAIYKVDEGEQKEGDEDEESSADIIDALATHDDEADILEKLGIEDENAVPYA